MSDKEIPCDQLYYGVGARESGHYWWQPDGPDQGDALNRYQHKIDPDGRVDDCVFGWEVDGKLQPEGRQIEGRCVLHRERPGWTALAWWDRSGSDKRSGCYSTFVMHGDHDFDVMVAVFSESFPWAARRMSFKLEIVEERGKT